MISPSPSDCNLFSGKSLSNRDSVEKLQQELASRDTKNQCEFR